MDAKTGDRVKSINKTGETGIIVKIKERPYPLPFEYRIKWDDPKLEYGTLHDGEFTIING